MAFATPGTNTLLCPTLCRISGLSLAAVGVPPIGIGTIGNHGDATADHQLPAGFALSATNTQAHINTAVTGAPGPMTSCLTITRPTGAPLQITVTSQDAVNSSGEFDILLENLVH